MENIAKERKIGNMLGASHCVGWHWSRKTVKTVKVPPYSRITLLKQGVNNTRDHTVSAHCLPHIVSAAVAEENGRRKTGGGNVARQKMPYPLYSKMVVADNLSEMGVFASLYNGIYA